MLRAFILLQLRKTLREHLAYFAIGPFLVFALSGVVAGITIRTLWVVQFLYLPVIASFLTAGVFFDDLKSRNLELLLSRGLAGELLVFCKTAASYSQALAVPIIGFVVSLVLGQPPRQSGEYMLISCSALLLWVAGFSLVSLLLHPRFNWLLILAIFLSISGWMAPVRQNTAWKGFSIVSGYDAFESLHRWGAFRPGLLLPVLIIVCLLVLAQILMVRKRWMITAKETL